MSLVLQLHLVMMSKYPKFGVDTFNTFWEMGYITVFAQLQQRRSSVKRSQYWIPWLILLKHILQIKHKWSYPSAYTLSLYFPCTNNLQKYPSLFAVMLCFIVSTAIIAPDTPFPVSLSTIWPLTPILAFN